MKRNLSFYSSILIVAAYLGLSLLAWLNFPSGYSPSSNWLSDLGSYELNPQGALFYNLGIILTGVALFPYFIGLNAWRLAGNRAQNVMLLLTMIFGCMGGLAMVMSAVFPISVPGAHSFWSAALYILLGTAFAFSVAAMRYHRAFPRWLVVLGVVVVVVDLVWSLVLNTTLMEWATIALFLAYILLLGFETKQKTSD